MAKVNVWRFEEEEFVEQSADGTLIGLEFTAVRRIARVDSADAAVKLLGVSGMRPLNIPKHPVVAKALYDACEHFGIPNPVAILRGVHGTFVVTREDSAPRSYSAVLETRAAL
jgi:hypothetical protein